MTEPELVGPSVDYVVERTLLLKEHADSVEELQTRARLAWQEILGREVQLLKVAGLSPRLAEQTGARDLALRKAELDTELSAALARERETLCKKLARLWEAYQDGEMG